MTDPTTHPACSRRCSCGPFCAPTRPLGRRTAAVRRGALAGVAALGCALAGAAAAVGYDAYRTSAPELVTTNFNPQADVAGPQLMAGACAIRFNTTGYWPTKHFNSAHICANVSDVTVNTAGQVVVTFGRPAAVMTVVVDEDETLSGRGILAGASSGVEQAVITLYDTRIGRRLNLNNVSDRTRVGGPASNLWLSFLQVGPSGTDPATAG